MPARFTRSATLNKVPGVLYSMAGRVDVGTDLGAVPVSGEAGITLTIKPGVIVYGATGVSWLAVNRGHKINAIGTATLPIVFTSRDNVLGLATTTLRASGAASCCSAAPRSPTAPWRRRPLPVRPPASARPKAPSIRRTSAAQTPADSSGVMKYVQIRYSGYVLSGNSELQSLTLGGVGSGTVIDHIHSHNSSDDAFENFGGRVSMKYLILTGADDDNIDVDTGWQGTLQYVLAVQKTTGAADSLIELDSTNTLEQQTPRTNLMLANFTFVHRNQVAGNQAAMLFRGGADATLVNGIVTSPTSCLRLVGGASPSVSVLAAADPAIGKIGPSVFSSVVFQCGATPFIGSTGLTAQQVADNFNGGTNNLATFTAVADERLRQRRERNGSRRNRCEDDRCALRHDHLHRRGQGRERHVVRGLDLQLGHRGLRHHRHRVHVAADQLKPADGGPGPATPATRATHIRLTHSRI